MIKKPIVDGVILRDGHIKCLWTCENCGFGELDIYSNKNDLNKTRYEDETDSFEVTTECMGEVFYQEILKSMIEYLQEHSIIIE